MIVEWRFTAFNVVFVSVTINSYILKDPSYSHDYYSMFDSHSNPKHSFLDKRRQSRIAAKRVQLLDRYLSNNSVYVDEVMHQIVDKKHKELNEVNAIEDAFKNLIGLNGVKFIYKRDQFWRTWRSVEYPQGDKIISYKCTSSANCTNCQNSGYWVIDETPPCPFEILSVISNDEVCAFNITNSTDNKQPCPSIVQFVDITRMCDNPISTVWRIQKVYNNVSERYPAVLCGGKDSCEFSTSYLITRNYVSFRIINSTNHILYSRVMKNNKINYACVADCGKLNPNTKTVSKADDPLVIDLINNKNKRDDKTQIDQSLISFDSTTAKETEFTSAEKVKNDKIKHALTEMETVFNFEEKPEKHHDIKRPSCSSVRRVMENDNMSDEEY